MATFAQLNASDNTIAGGGAYWFSPVISNTDDGALVIVPYTDDYGSGAPWNVTLTTILVDQSGKAVAAPIALASYQTGRNFHVAATALANGETAVVYDVANASNPSTGVDIDVQVVDAAGHAVGGPKTLVSDAVDVQQFRVGSDASNGSTYDLAYATLDTTTDRETIEYAVFGADGTPVAGASGTIDTVHTQNGSGFGLAQAPGSSKYVFVRAVGNGVGTSPVGLKYIVTGANGAPASSVAYIDPAYPAGSSSGVLVDFDDLRLTPAASGPDLVTASRVTYADSIGSEHEAIDVKTINTTSGSVSADVVIPVAVGSSGLQLTRLANGGFVLDYGAQATASPTLQAFDANGDTVGSAYSLPSTDTNSESATLNDGNLLVEYRSNAASGNQLNDDVYSTPCYVMGTLIRTPCGQDPIETLTIGDLVLSADGTPRSVKWMGYRTIDPVEKRFANPDAVMPVRIRAGALGESLPARDLLLSPDHAVLIEGVLVQAGAMVNGTTMVRETRREPFTYWHVELGDHELILAEGVPAETFVSNASRMGFDNWAEHQALYGAEPEVVEMDTPRVQSARQLPQRVRGRLAERAKALLERFEYAPASAA